MQLTWPTLTQMLVTLMATAVTTSLILIKLSSVLGLDLDGALEEISHNGKHVGGECEPSSRSCH